MAPASSFLRLQLGSPQRPGCTFWVKDLCEWDALGAAVSLFTGHFHCHVLTSQQNTPTSRQGRRAGCSFMGPLWCLGQLQPVVWTSQMALMVKYPPANAGGTRDEGSIPGSGRSPGEENGNPLQYSCLENLMDRGTWWLAVHGVSKSQTLSDLAHMHISCLQK